jgi:hypothetical protein
VAVRESTLDGGLLDYDTESLTVEWTIVGNILVSAMHVIDIFRRYLKKNSHIVATTKADVFLHTQISILFQWQLKLVSPIFILISS